MKIIKGIKLCLNNPEQIEMLLLHMVCYLTAYKFGCHAWMNAVQLTHRLGVFTNIELFFILFYILLYHIYRLSWRAVLRGPLSSFSVAVVRRCAVGVSAVC